VDNLGSFVNHPVVKPPSKQERRDRSLVSTLLGYSEFLLDAAVAVALAVGGAILLAVVLSDYARTLGQKPTDTQAFDLLSGLLLVFIFTELISTLRVIIARRSIDVEPFLIIGIVATIRRLIVVSAEAEGRVGTPAFRDIMIEIGVLAATALILGITVLVLRILRGRDQSSPAVPSDRGEGGGR
jgi:uncharacterized membrane protein (DUF373 family)